MGDGNGLFQEVTEIDVPSMDTPRGLACGELNGDGLLDVVVLNEGKLEVFLNASR